MPRVRKGAARTQARNRLLQAVRGYQGTRRRLKPQAKIAVLRAGQFAYRDRRNRKRDLRRLWITRLSAACRMRGTRYSLFINGLQQAGCLLNRKMLSQLAIDDPAVFDDLVVMASNKDEAAVEKPRRRRANPAPT
ncbi:MAG: 50S ribosomal protein L20 [Planctomycetota bacterium]|jgi:large subunit ribosomal protein L20